MHLVGEAVHAGPLVCAPSVRRANAARGPKHLQKNVPAAVPRGRREHDVRATLGAEFALLDGAPPVRARSTCAACPRSEPTVYGGRGEPALPIRTPAHRARPATHIAPGEPVKASDYVVRFLQARGVTHVFELPGGIISHLLDSLHRLGGVRVVTVHHEQAAAFAADGFGRIAGRPAVGLGTVGPGAINLLNGIASAYFDSSPALFLAGQVQTYLQKGSRPARQLGFQEADFVSMVAPVCKGAFRVTKAAELPDVLDRALHLALEGRPGPTVVELPIDVQAAPLEAQPGAFTPPLRAAPEEARVDGALALLEAAERPLLLAGGGVRAARAFEALRRFARLAQAPVATSLMALDALPAGDPLHVGLIGMYGLRAANLALLESDLVLALGSRLDHGQTGADVGAFKRGRRIVQVECDPSELELRLRGATTVPGDVGAFLEAACRRLAASGPGAAARAERRAAWQARVAELRERHPDTAELAQCEGINPNLLLRELSEVSAAAAAFVVDSGQHTWWAAQSLRLRAGQRFLAGSGLGAMGFALPAAIGACYASDEAPVVVIVGDGALQINIQELQTLVRQRLPLKLVVLNNHCHGMVRQFQEEAFERRYPSTLLGYDTPDFARVAAAYGLRARTLGAADDARAALEWLWDDPRAPSLLQVELSPFTNVYPIVPYGAPLSAMRAFERGTPR